MDASTLYVDPILAGGNEEFYSIDVPGAQAAPPAAPASSDLNNNRNNDDVEVDLRAFAASGNPQKHDARIPMSAASFSKERSPRIPGKAPGVAPTSSSKKKDKRRAV